MEKQKLSESKNTFRRWSKKDDTTLRKMIKLGKNSEEIAIVLDRTRSAVVARKSVLGVKGRMMPAKGSQMPYVSFKRNQKPQEVQPIEVMEEITLGQKIDDLLLTSKRMGISLKITVES